VHGVSNGVSSFQEAPVRTVIDILTEDHHLVDRLFDAYFASHDAAVAQRLGDVLVLHARIEGEFLYPFVRTAVRDGHVLASEAEDDHELVKAFVAEAEDTFGDALDELLLELRADVRVHQRWEEDDLFPVLVEQADPDALDALAVRIDAFRRSHTVA
jgi:hemerythrin superfamily protein